MSNLKSVNIFQLGVVDYDRGYELQSKLHELYRQGRANESLILLQHEHVLTLGKSDYH